MYIDIDMASPENINIVIDKDILENIDIDKEILGNIDIEEEILQNIGAKTSLPGDGI